MQEIEILRSLEETAKRLGVTVIYEHLEHNGGLCYVKGEPKIFINDHLSLKRKIAIMAKALSSFNLENIYILPFVREIIAKYKSKK